MQTASYKMFKNTSQHLTFLLSFEGVDLKLIQLWLSFYLKLNVSKEAVLNPSKPLMRCRAYSLTVRLMPLINRSKQDFIQNMTSYEFHTEGVGHGGLQKRYQNLVLSLYVELCQAEIIAKRISRTLNALLSPCVVNVMFYNQPLCLNLVWTTFFSTKLLIQVVYSNLLCGHSGLK